MSWGGTGRGSGPDSKTNKIQTYYVPLMRNAADSRELKENTHSQRYGRAIPTVSKINPEDSKYDRDGTWTNGSIS